MNAPQIIVICWLVFRAVVAAASHGLELKYRANGLCQWVSIAIAALVLYWGGFWSHT